MLGSEYLCQDAPLVGAVDVVRCLSSLVGKVQQAAIIGVPQEQLSQLAASSDGDVEGSVSFLIEGRFIGVLIVILILLLYIYLCIRPQTHI